MRKSTTSFYSFLSISLLSGGLVRAQDTDAAKQYMDKIDKLHFDSMQCLNGIQSFLPKHHDEIKNNYLIEQNLLIELKPDSAGKYHVFGPHSTATLKISDFKNPVKLKEKDALEKIKIEKTEFDAFKKPTVSQICFPKGKALIAIIDSSGKAFPILKFVERNPELECSSNIESFREVGQEVTEKLKSIVEGSIKYGLMWDANVRDELVTRGWKSESDYNFTRLMPPNEEQIKAVPSGLGARNRSLDEWLEYSKLHAQNLYTVLTDCKELLASNYFDSTIKNIVTNRAKRLLASKAATDKVIPPDQNHPKRLEWEGVVLEIDKLDSLVNSKPVVVPSKGTTSGAPTKGSALPPEATPKKQ